MIGAQRFLIAVLAALLASGTLTGAPPRRDPLEELPKDLRRDIQLLESSDENVRLRIARRLAKRKTLPTKAVHLIGKRILRESPKAWKVQVELLKLLVTTGDHAALEYLNEIVRYPNNYHYVIVIDAARGIGKVAKRDDVTSVRLLDILIDEHKDKQVRRAAAESIGRIGNMLGLRRVYIAAAEDSDKRVRDTCADAVRRLKPGAADYARLLANESEAVRVRAAEDLRKMAKEIPPEDMEAVCRAAVSSPFAQVRVACLDIITKANKEAGRKEIVSLIRYDRDVNVRHAAMTAAGVVKLHEAVDALVFLLEFDRSTRIREECAKVLGILGDVEAIEALYRAAVGDESPDVKRAAEEALKKLE